MDKLPIKQRQKDKLTERQPFQHKHTATQISCYMLCEDKKIFFSYPFSLYVSQRKRLIDHQDIQITRKQGRE